MSESWIKIDTSLTQKPQVIQMAEALGLDEFAVTGRLVQLWTWADTHVTDSTHAVAVTKRFLDRLVCHDGFVTQLCNVGWLTGTDGAYTFPDFEQHNGPTAKRRATDQRRQNRHRDAKTAETAQNQPKTPQNTPAVTPTSAESHAATVTEITPTSRNDRDAKRDATVTRERVRGDTYNTDTQNPPNPLANFSQNQAAPTPSVPVGVRPCSSPTDARNHTAPFSIADLTGEPAPPAEDHPGLLNFIARATGKLPADALPAWEQWCRHMWEISRSVPLLAQDKHLAKAHALLAQGTLNDFAESVDYSIESVKKTLCKKWPELQPEATTRPRKTRAAATAYDAKKKVNYNE